MLFNACLNMSHHGPLHPVKRCQRSCRQSDRHPQCNEVPLHCQQELHAQGFLGIPTGRNPEDSNLASVEVMQWVLLHISISYWEHLAQHRQNVPQHHHTCTTFVLTASGISSSSFGRSCKRKSWQWLPVSWCGPTKESATILAHTLMLNCC
jgi:hypothetical protein